MSLQIKRIYEKPAKTDGYRVLIDRLWPRGLSKQKAHIDVWLKDIAPSKELREWFNHDPSKWSEFRNRYKSEIKESLALKELHELIEQHDTITLLYSAHDTEHNNAVALLDLIK